jgi:hypothetical protein
MLSAAVDGLLRMGISALSIPVQLALRGFKHAFDPCINYCHGPFVGSVSYLFVGIEPIATLANMKWIKMFTVCQDRRVFYTYVYKGIVCVYKILLFSFKFFFFFLGVI